MLSTAKIAQIDLEWRGTRDHFTHEIESPRPIYFKHFHWWERWRWSKFASHYTRGTNILCKMQDGCESLHLDYFQKPPLIGRPNTKLGDHGTPNAHNCWFILFYHDWGPAPTKTYWNSIWSRVWSPMTSHYTTTPHYTPLHDFGGVLGLPLDTFFWAFTSSWSRLLAHVWSGPPLKHRTRVNWPFLRRCCTTQLRIVTHTNNAPFPRDFN